VIENRDEEANQRTGDVNREGRKNGGRE